MTVDLSKVPQMTQTPAQHDERMQWFRDAKFGMFIHWGPCSVGKREIGWGRNARRPWDIGIPDPSDDTHDAEYDNYYKVFNPERYDADAWARFAKESGMTYMVLITKHHDGFSQFDTKLSDYSIMATPYGRDIVKPFVEACHKHGLKAGLYYSTRDWYHPDYLVGDNKAYDEWYRGQVEELLTNYGKVDMMWFDHVGGRDWGKWKFDELFAMMYRCQPELLVNNRAARFCGPTTPEDQGPESPEFEHMTLGDFYTPEGKIGAMDIENDWESCIHVGQGWSYRGEDGFKGPEDCIKMLASCTTGGGNLLLNFGPRPDGTFTDGEAAVARAMGEWLNQYGEAVYGTRGGPLQNGDWGGSCHKGNKVFLHVYEWTQDTLELPPLPHQVLAARTLEDKPVTFTQDEARLAVSVADTDRDTPVTVIKLTLDAAIEPGCLTGQAPAEQEADARVVGPPPGQD
ncbi:MAG: alpha-L-fucosidase [Kiritimatiellae bacterium]|nr:alpha-L-fucosidase [Kiritimatiellia bacterium]